MLIQAFEYLKVQLRSHRPVDPIFEFGSLLVPGGGAHADLRPLFKGRVFTGCDMRDGPGVSLVMNVEDIQLPAGFAGCIIMLDTLEHVKDPHRAMREVYRVLQPGGLCVISSVFAFPIHDHPCDYWRFTPECFKLLLEPFFHKEIDSWGHEGCPVGVMGHGIK